MDESSLLGLLDPELLLQSHWVIFLLLLGSIEDDLGLLFLLFTFYFFFNMIIVTHPPTIKYSMVCSFATLYRRRCHSPGHVSSPQDFHRFRQNQFTISFLQNFTITN